MAQMRALHRRLQFLFDDLTDYLPVSFALPCILVGGIVPFIVADLPPTESIPAVLVLAGLLVIIWRQWFQMEALRDELRDAEDELDYVPAMQFPRAAQICRVGTGRKRKTWRTQPLPP